MTRVLLKLSGEQLGGSDGGFDVERASWIAEEIKKTKQIAKEKGEKVEIAIIVGGGNFLRGGNLVENDTRIERDTADNAGMLATIMNAILLRDVFDSLGVPVWVFSKLAVSRVVEEMTHWRAKQKLADGKVVIIGGGTGNPWVTTDSGAVNLALELDCDLVLKATKVDGVYDSDPTKNPDARKIDHLSYEDAINAQGIRIMDKAALGAAGDAKLPIIVFELLKPGNIIAAIDGAVGTRIA
ncbi:uridine monophosphate kinase [Candidatus Saccharibacteria bacterium]|nr:uridine monophosphate kinase [Candidatus Saccharibacteria bacterium]MCL1963287.1 uridine monophosphate kinase [Candidatus Saccharibacteria bacterium]